MLLFFTCFHSNVCEIVFQLISAINMYSAIFFQGVKGIKNSISIFVVFIVMCLRKKKKEKHINNRIISSF